MTTPEKSVPRVSRFTYVPCAQAILMGFQGRAREALEAVNADVLARSEMDKGFDYAAALHRLAAAAARQRQAVRDEAQRALGQLRPELPERRSDALVVPPPASSGSSRVA